MILRVFVGVMMAAPVAAEPVIPGAVRPEGTALVTLAGYVAGLNVMNIEAGLELGRDGYRLGLSVQTAGMVGALLHGETRSRVEGGWQGNVAVPRHYSSAGTWLGSPRAIDIDYRDGVPRIEVLTPPVDQEREPVPDALQRDTTDGLSAISFLIETVAATGRCEGHTRTFDGRRLAEVTARTVGEEVLPRESRSSFAGTALRCDLDGRQLAGFPLDAGPDDMLRRPEHSSVWFAKLQPGAIPVPVFAIFEVRRIGLVRLYITNAQPRVDMAAFTPNLAVR